MQNYEKLVKALRCKRDDCEGCDLAFFDKDEGWMCQYAAKDDDAADAIEELKDKPWVESVQIDKLRQRIDELEETACHCNVKENAELIAKILDDDVDGKVFELPKRGKWIDDEFTSKGRCSVCGEEWSWFDNCMETFKYCPNCGAKMFASDINVLNKNGTTDCPIITPCRGCSDYDGYGGCKSKGGCARKMEVQDG